MGFLAVAAAVLALAPPGTDVDLRAVAARPARLSYVVAVWRRPGYGPVSAGVRVWRLTPGSREFLYRRGYPLGHVGARTGELTGDGVPELLLETGEGSGDCGVRRILDLGHERARELWRRYTCDTTVWISQRQLRIDSGEYVPGDSHCCPMFSRHSVLAWRRSRLLRTRSVVFWNCVACLNPAYLPGFHPRRAAFWDPRRGVAIAGPPWRIGWTADGGRSWTTSTVAPWRLGPPRIHRVGRAVVRFRCRRCPLGYRVARTRDFGKTWTVSG